MQMRAQRYLAQCGIQSRRESERIIQQGRVTVNGKRLAHPRLIDIERDVVAVDGRRITVAPKVYYAFHKPINVICSAVRQGSYPLVWDFIRAYRKMHLFTIGRLDRLTSGLLLITNDSAFSERILLPQHKIEKEYIVHTYDPIPVDRIRKFMPSARSQQPYTIKKYHFVSKRCIKLIITEGKHHEVRNIMRFCGCGISSLMRIRIDQIQLQALQPGRYRELSARERIQIAAQEL